MKVDVITGWIINRGIWYWFGQGVGYELYRCGGEEIYERVELEVGAKVVIIKNW